MNRNRKDIRITVLIFAVTIAVAVIIYFASQTPQYETDDPLHGSYLVEKEEQAEIIHPANFVVSITGGVAVSESSQSMQETGIDMSKPWIYCAEEDKFFQAEKEKEKLFVYEGGKKIGTLSYSYKKFLWIHYDEFYEIEWRDANIKLIKTAQYQVF